MDQVAALRAFTRIVQTGSFTQASALLRVPKPTVSKLVQQLEAHLQTKLLSRTTRRLAVTSDGAAYYERAVQVLADLEELDASVTASQARPKGKLRIDVSSSLAQLVIVPALGRFFGKYPDIQLEIGTSDRPTDLVAENVDCVIRAGADRRPLVDRPAHRGHAPDHLRGAIIPPGAWPTRAPGGVGNRPSDRRLSQRPNGRGAPVVVHTRRPDAGGGGTISGGGE